MPISWWTGHEADWVALGAGVAMVGLGWLYRHFDKRIEKVANTQTQCRIEHDSTTTASLNRVHERIDRVDEKVDDIIHTLGEIPERVVNLLDKARHLGDAP